LVVALRPAYVDPTCNQRYRSPQMTTAAAPYEHVEVFHGIQIADGAGAALEGDACSWQVSFETLSLDTACRAPLSATCYRRDVRIAAFGLLLVACAPVAAPAMIANKAGVEKPQRQPLVCRTLIVGSRQPTMTRLISELSIDGSSASLVEIEQQAPGALTLERADREAKWKTTRTTVRKGPVQHAGDQIKLVLEGPVDSISLQCSHRKVEVALAGARRISRPGHERDCDDAGAWSPATATSVDALVCGAEDAGDPSDLMTNWQFAAPPGIETVDELEDCRRGDALRLAK
jgi:hypothetical protein